MKKKIRSLIISDIHIGVKYNNAKALLELLDKYEFENLFLVGDIIDMTSMMRRAFWKKAYWKLIKKLVKLSEDVRIVYITGNHDHLLRSFTPFKTGICEVVDEFTYGDTLLIHGDKFDRLMYKRRYLYWLGDIGYNLVIWCDKWCCLGGRLSKKAKRIVKKASNYLNDFYTLAVKYTQKRDCKRIICGHTHHQERRNIEGIEYLNCGDFRESTDYIVEDYDGNFTLMGK